MKTRHFTYFTLICVVLIGLFILDLTWGSVSIPLKQILSSFTNKNLTEVNAEILWNLRLPKALTAILAGMALATAGLLMQTLFRNPLADPYILGVSSGASLGVAVIVMASTIFPFTFIPNNWLMVTAAITGALFILFLIVGFSLKVSNSVSLLIIGIMFGIFSSSIVHIIQNFSNPDNLKSFVVWTFGSLSAVTWDYLIILGGIVAIGISMAMYLQKNLDGLLLGENYAKALGISVVNTRALLVISAGLLAGGITAFTGPISFIGVAIPHLARSIFKCSTHKVLLPACALLGATLLLLCDIVSQIPTYTLPINTISALFGAPVVIWVILKRK